ncbi:MAG: hypothetical protein Q8N45_06875, partial [Anaerolineales bacterium]|nr:hypothetical protein [Anaerolineales bacterium]
LGVISNFFPASKPPVAELYVHERTVAKKVSSILQKLHLANRTQAALYAVRKGLTGLPDKNTGRGPL